MKVIVLLGILFLLLTAQKSGANLGCASTNPKTGACLTCPPQLSLDSAGICGIYTPVDRCAIYNSVPPYNCLQCNTNSRFYQGSCVSLPSNCAEGWGQSDCIRCSNNYLLLEYVQCASLNTTVCAPSSFPRLQLGQPYCQTYDNAFCSNTTSQLCTQCINGYEPVNGLCMKVIAKASCLNNGCSCTRYFYQDVCYQFGLEGCILSQDNIDCDVCEDNFQSSGFYCYKPFKADDMHCNNIDANGDCTGCNSDYFLTPNLYCVKDFKQCGDNNGNCTSCINSRFTLIGGLCYYDDGHCVVYDFTKAGACLTCDLLYSLNANNVCVKTESCRSYDSAGLLCTKCFSIFQLNAAGGCQPLPSNCLSMNSTGCSSCTQQTSLWLNPNNQYQCVYLTTYGLAYNMYGRCTQCDISKSVILLKSYCVPIATNCKTPFPKDLTRCSVCQQDYHIDINSNTCFLNMAGCYSYISGSMCQSCLSGFLLVDTECVTATTDCTGLTADGACISCGNGYVSVDNYCVIYDPYCNAYDSSTRVCSSSQFDSFSLGAISQAQITAYKAFITNSLNGGGGSSSGAGQFDPTNQYIISLPYAGVTSTMISSYDFNGLITACKSPYTLFNDQCVTSTPNCLQYNVIGACQICQAGYDMGPAGACVLSTSVSCTLRISNVCKQAAPGYTIYNGNAYSTSRYGVSAGGSVPNGYFLSSGLAWRLSAGCLSQQIPGVCDTCRTGFTFYSAGKCVLLRFSCTVYNAYGVCSGCTTSTMLWAGQCRQKQCSNLDLSTGYCSRCVAGYNYLLGICIPPSLPNCLIYYQLGCLSCAANYYLSSALTCQLLPRNCAQASTADRCINCVTDYTLSGSNCVRTIPFCSTYGPTGACVSSLFGYSIINNGALVVQNIDHCKKMLSSTACQICDTNYQPFSQGNVSLCVTPVAKCALYDMKSGCVQCTPGFVLQKNMCRSIRCNAFTTECTSCISPFQLSNGNCIDLNCITYTNQTCQSCSTTIPSLTLINGDCVIPVLNCLQYERGICSSCEQFYVPMNNTCMYVLTNITNCNSYDRNHQYCVTCIDNYNIPSDPDLKSCCVASIPHCATYSCNGCKSCYIEYTLPTDQFTFSCCVLKVAYCSTYNCTGCTSCVNGLQLSANQTCSIPNCLQQLIVNGINICKQCAVGYNYPAANIQICCVKHIVACLTQGCNGCTACQGLQQLINGSCGCLTFVGQRCSQCLTGLVNSADGQCCVASVTNCQGYSCSGCSSCSSGYTAVGSPLVCCVASVVNCRSYSCSECIACTGSLILQNGQCSNTISNCLNQTGLICLQCSPGYQTPSSTLNSCCVRVISNCIAYNCNGCQSCQSPFSLIGGICGITNCQTLIGTICSVCTPPYVLSSDQTCCLTPVANCATYSCSGCTTCFIGFNYTFGVCISSVPNCVSYSNTGQCVSCASPFTPPSSGNCCIMVIPNCVSTLCDGCRQCAPNYSLIQKTCSSGTISNCSSYSLNSQNQIKCVTCNAMYNLPSDGSGSCCISSVNNCQTYSCSGGCVLCSPSYVILLGGCYPASIDNCAVYGLLNGSPICTTCSINYQADPNKACCVATINQCFSYSCTQRCATCNPGFIVQAGSPPQCVSVGQIANCQNVVQNPNGVPTCSLCNQGFSLSTGSNCCTATQPNCGAYSCSGCSSCTSGYTIYQNTQCALENCKVFGANLSVCITCNTNYILRTNQQNATCCVLTVSQCVSYSCLGCQSCQSGFNLNGGVCQQPIPNCQTFTTNSTTKCLKCAAGYSLSMDSSCCVMTVTYCLSYDCRGCVTCLPGTTVLSDGSCGIPNCALINFNGPASTCLTCASNFRVPNSQNATCCVRISVNCVRYQCIGCTSCKAGLTLLPDRTCGLVDCFTLEQSANGAYYCSLCVPSYVTPSDGSRSCCVFAYANCLSYNCSGCSQCSSGFYLINGTCSITNCLKVNASICTNCVQGYTQDTTNTCCVVQITSCIAYSCTQGCIRCASGATLTNTICSSTSIPNCQAGSSVISGANLICLSCISPYRLPTDNSKICCIEPPSNCIAYNCNGCTQCSSGFSFQPDRSCGIPNCISTVLSNGNYLCQRCAGGYTGNSGAVSQCCVQTVAACVAYNCGGCTQCSNGYPPVNAQCQVLNCISSSVNPQNVPICLQCENGYSPPSDRSQYCCLKNVDNCIIYSCGTGCTSCLSPNVLSFNGQCISPCQNGYYYSNTAGSCIILPQNCLSASASGYCLSCTPGYTPSNSLTTPCVTLNLPQFCALSSGGVCTQCNPGYSLNTDQSTGAITCVVQNSFCQQFFNGLCYICMAGYTLDPARGVCVSSSIVCTNYDSSRRCIGCPNRYYILNYVCYQYPLYCVAVDLIGNCLSCAFGSSLSKGFCLMTSVDARSTNCQCFNSTTNLCKTCLPGYYFCSGTGVCLMLDPACRTYSTDQQSCLSCQSGYQSYNGRCLMYPPGVLSTTGGVSCAANYVNTGTTCVRSASSLTSVSSMGNVLFTYSSGAPLGNPYLNSAYYWRPTSNKMNEYFGVSSLNGVSMVIFQIAVMGSTGGWITSYIIQYRNKPTSPFICFRNCMGIQGAVSPSIAATLRLDQPIVASDIRIYPVAWFSGIISQIELWVLQTS